jgi:hypothetical protein
MRFFKIRKTKKRRQLVRVKKFGLYFLFKYFVLLDYSGVRGGGKCPEEEHTTCSGGPTILVTSAVYGEREKRIKYSLKKRIFYKMKL